MQAQYSMRSPAVKRLMKEAQELKDPTELYHAQPLEDNLFEWHFTLRGPEDSDFDGGIYHGRIILPPEYPMKPPSIILLTPNGRFETFKKICLSISGHHPESWQPSWSIRTALLAIIGFMPTHGGGAIGSLDYTPEERKVLAKRSQDWKCPECGDVSQKLKPKTQASEEAAQEAKELASQINFQETNDELPVAAISRLYPGRETGKNQ
ncbi:ubiquitin-conjugating enzyme E2 J1-like isoform X3 [Babylonia areolata]|uniref:ubiquitin-conjugating enzyme E2 J1-like isoform X3 n=1 Tax=Babylonia areolata TaxID=304850 RepID=UPI003FD2CA40